MQIQGAIALVTGANGGIGRHCIQGLQAAGATHIYAGARNPDSLKDIAATDPDRIIPIPLDITDEASVKAAVEAYSDVNLLINNADVGFNQRLVADINFDKVRSEIEVNYLGCCGFVWHLLQSSKPMEVERSSICSPFWQR